MASLTSKLETVAVKEIVKGRAQALAETAVETIKALEAHAEGRHSEYLKRPAVEESDANLSAEAMIN